MSSINFLGHLLVQSVLPLCPVDTFVDRTDRRQPVDFDLSTFTAAMSRRSILLGKQKVWKLGDQSELPSRRQYQQRPAVTAPTRRLS